MAGAAIFDINIGGMGSHAAMPHQSKDPIIIAHELITQLQSILSRNVPPLETIVLSRQMSIKIAFQTALTMSFISMLAMEIAMNSVDWLILGEAKLVWWIVPIMLLTGFLTPWPYNYYCLKKYNIACH